MQGKINTNSSIDKLTGTKFTVGYVFALRNRQGGFYPVRLPTNSLTVGSVLRTHKHIYI